MTARKPVRRKTSTAMVYNPSRSLSVKANPPRKRRRRTSVSRRRRNPVVKTAVRRTAVRRKANPATMGGLAAAAVVAGIGVAAFDWLTVKVVPNQSAVVRAGVKLGGAFLFQSRYGSKVPLLGKYKNDIALVLAVAGVVDLMKLYVFPIVNNAVGSVTQNLLPAPATDDQTTGNIYGNAFAPQSPRIYS